MMYIYMPEAENNCEIFHHVVEDIAMHVQIELRDHVL